MTKESTSYSQLKINSRPSSNKNHEVSMKMASSSLQNDGRQFLKTKKTFLKIFSHPIKAVNPLRRKEVTELQN